MANMSYCRMRNTLEDLQDCFNNMDDVDEEKNPAEVKARKRLVALCKRIADDYEDLLND